ncbi:hypothetical protein [Clostridium pasteurianum]|uniref:HoxN/HupN/NixA family nickel/cobalt transporter n=1 Tax=Clostridium pasteurianum TaxID=1501 RepID=UPI003D6D20F0
MLVFSFPLDVHLWCLLCQFYYNLSVTGLSIVAALCIGFIELAQILRFKFGLNTGIWRRIQNIDYSGIGYLLVGLFIISWGVSYMIWKMLRFENT